MQKTRCVKMPAFDTKYHRGSEWQQIFTPTTNRCSSRHRSFPWQWWSKDKLHISNIWNSFFIQTDRVLHPGLLQPSCNAGGIDRNCTSLPPTHLWPWSGPISRVIALLLNPIPHRATSFPQMPDCFSTQPVGLMLWFPATDSRGWSLSTGAFELLSS